MYLVTRRKPKKLVPMTIVCQFHCNISVIKLFVNFVFNIQTPVIPTVGNFKFRHGLVQIRTPGY